MKSTGAATTSTPISVIGRAALQGLPAWMIYAVVECAAAWGIPVARGTDSSTAGAAELYDEADDPGERHNLHGKENREAAALERSLVSWVSAIPKAERVSGKVDGRTLNSLKPLGYVQ